MKSKITFIIFFIVIFLIFLSTSILSYSTTNHKPTYGIVNATNVNFRKKASLNLSDIVSKLNKNTKVKILGSIDDFYIVQLENSSVGLISKNYITKSEEKLENSKTYENLEKFYVYADGENINVRGGPSTSYPIYTKLNKNEIIEVIGKIENFYMIVTKNKIIGMVKEDLVKKSNNSNLSSNNNNLEPNNISIQEMKEKMLQIINNKRIENGLFKFVSNESLENLAQVKANDMVSNNYFSHNSNTYGSPFDMLKNAGIIYKSAGENIAGNNDFNDAINSWFESIDHRKNLLSNKFNNIGIGITKSNTYGYIFVILFIEK